MPEYAERKEFLHETRESRRKQDMGMTMTQKILAAHAGLDQV